MGKRSNESLYELPEVKLPKKVPQLSVISATNIQAMPLAVLLAEAHSLREAERRLKEIKDRIREKVQLEGHGSGVRAGTACAIVRMSEGRASISRELLIEHGVSPQQIELSTKRGDPFWVVELPEITEEG